MMTARPKARASGRRVPVHGELGCSLLIVSLVTGCDVTRGVRGRRPADGGALDAERSAPVAGRAERLDARFRFSA